MESYRRRDLLEIDGKRQRGTNREEETERRGTGEQTKRRILVPYIPSMSMMVKGHSLLY